MQPAWLAAPQFDEAAAIPCCITIPIHVKFQGAVLHGDVPGCVPCVRATSGGRVPCACIGEASRHCTAWERKRRQFVYWGCAEQLQTTQARPRTSVLAAPACVTCARLSAAAAPRRRHGAGILQVLAFKRRPAAGLPRPHATGCIMKSGGAWRKARPGRRGGAAAALMRPHGASAPPSNCLPCQPSRLLLASKSPPPSSHDC